MMRWMNNKANVKIFSIVIAAIFIIGIGALAYTQMATPTGSSGNSTIGVV
ncbi:Gram-positive signal peptide protein, YSIRK family, partial [human gut metagenome]